MEDLYYFSKEAPALLKTIADKATQNSCKVTLFKEGATLFLQGEGDSDAWFDNAYWNFETNKIASLIEWLSGGDEETQHFLFELNLYSFLSVTFHLGSLPCLLALLKEVMEIEGGFISFQDNLIPRYYLEDIEDLYQNISRTPPKGLQHL